jgi:hypothetical protein
MARWNTLPFVAGVVWMLLLGSPTQIRCRKLANNDAVVTEVPQTLHRSLLQSYGYILFFEFATTTGGGGGKVTAYFASQSERDTALTAKFVSLRTKYIIVIFNYYII